MIAHLILYVADQARSTRFFEAVLEQRPVLNVPGMTEFQLAEGCVLGLMPRSGAAALLGLAIAREVERTARAELYLVVSDPAAHHRRALANGATELSPLRPREWGDTVAYSLDRDGHVLAFASRAKAQRRR